MLELSLNRPQHIILHDAERNVSGTYGTMPMPYGLSRRTLPWKSRRHASSIVPKDESLDIVFILHKVLDDSSTIAGVTI